MCRPHTKIAEQTESQKRGKYQKLKSKERRGKLHNYAHTGHIRDGVAFTEVATKNRTLNTRPISAHCGVAHIRGEKVTTCQRSLRANA